VARPAGAGAAPAGGGRPVPEILRDLGSQAYAVRERAQAELATVPLEQLNALRNAERGTRDEEVKARLHTRIVELEREGAREVLARFAEAQNKLTAMSYRESSTEECVQGGKKTTIHYRTEVRYDADLADRRQWKWGDLQEPPKGAIPGDAPMPWPTFGEERAEYRHQFWVGTEMLDFYRWDDPLSPYPRRLQINGPEGRKVAAPPRQGRAMAVHAAPLFGYIGGLGIRCDVALKESADLRLRPATELVGGAPCQVIEARQPDSYGLPRRYTLWFDPAHGYSLVRIDEWSGPNKSGATAEYHLLRAEYVRNGDLWLPAKADSTYTQVLPDGVTYRGKVHAEVTDVRVGAESGGWQKTVLADIPEGVTVTPMGMKVRNRGTWQGGKAVDENGEVFFDAAVGGTGPAPSAEATKPAAAAVRPAGVGAAPVWGSRPLPEILRDLGSQAYAVRERAQAELATAPLGQLNALRNAEKGTRDAEVKARLGKRIVELERDGAREVLARFAETQNKLTAMSYRAFSTTEWVMGGPKKMLYYRTEVRYDADLADRRQWHWGDLQAPPTGPIQGEIPEPWPTFGEERAEYRHHYWVGTEMLQFYRFDDPMWWRDYGGQGDPRQGFVRIQGTGDAWPPRQCQAMAVHAGPLFGYNLGGLTNRCDIALRDAAELKLRQATEMVGGVPCQVVEARQPDKYGVEWRYTLWFDPAHDYNLARMDSRAGPAKDGSSGEYHLVRVEFARHGDLWLPAKADMTYTDVRPGRATSRDKVHLEITDVRVGAESGGWQKTALADIPDGVPVTPDYKMKVRTPGTWQGGKVVDENGNVFFDAAVGSVEPKPDAGATKPAMKPAAKPERVLEFGAGRSLGQLLMEDETNQRRMEMGRETFLGQATGTVKVPAGKRLRLSVWANGSPDLSPLAKLDPDALHCLTLAGFTLSDQAMAAVAPLMGLRELDLHRSKVSASGFLYVARLKNLEYLTLPPNLGDQDLGVIAVLPKLKGLYIFNQDENRISNEGLKLVRPSLEELMIGGGTMNDAGLARLKEFSRLTHLSLWGDRFTGRGLARLSAHPTLRVCDFSGLGNMTDDAMASLAAMPALEKLSLTNNAKLTDRGLASLSGARALRKLNLSGTKLSAAGVARVTEIRTLEDLELPKSSLTDEGLATVGNMTQLKRLRMVNGAQYTAQGLSHIAKLGQLEDLGVSGQAVTDESVDVIARCGGLKKLWISDAPLSNAGVAKLAALKSLEDLGLADTQVTIGGFNALGALPGLKKLFLYNVPEGGPALDLGGCTALEYLTLYTAKNGAVRDQDMACLEKLTHLRSLQLSAAVSDAGLKHVSGLTDLGNLIVANSDQNAQAGAKVTDAGLAHLSGLNRLISLTVAGDFNGSGLKHLQGLQTLNVVEVYSTREMDAKAVADLRRALPGAMHYEVGKRVVLPAKPVAATRRGGV
jgi:hypothetical protein